jgi:protein tyrosine/serine phosphatase
MSLFSAVIFSFIVSVSSQAFSQQNYFNSNVVGVDDYGVRGPLINGLPNFQKTTDSIYRGGRPTLEGIQYLKKSGFKTIINIENNSKAISAELAMAKKLGLQMYSSPMSWTTSPNDKQVNSVLAALNNPQLYPIYIHCHYGKDRTGLIIGLYRVFSQNWSPKDAYAEMLKYGFHPEYKPLDDYFRVKTKMRR